jgi:hypothetical protein
MRSRLVAAAALALAWIRPAGATDIGIPGKIGMVKPGLFKIVSRPVGAFTIPAPGSGTDPLIVGGDVHVFDTDGSGDMFDSLTGFPPGEGWSGLGNPPGISGYKYKNTQAPTGGDVKIIIFKPTVIKILAKGTGSLFTPIGLNLGVELITGTDKRCAEFGGTTIKNMSSPNPLFKRKDAPAPGVCPSTGVPGCPGCNGDSFINFSTANTPGDCGDVLDSGGMLVRNINCAGIYSGGGGNFVPLPYSIPDQTSLVTSITSCLGSVAGVGPTTSTQTGSNLNCTASGCRFGAPLAIPNAASTPTSICVQYAFAAPPSGNVDCATGATSIALPLSATLYLTGDTATDPSDTIAGIQPCPLCTGGSCVGGPNNSMLCVPGTTTLGGNPAYPTSQHCPPDPMFSIGTLPINFTLSSGTVSWTGTIATNGSPVSVQNRVFSGYCRDKDGTGLFENPAHQCWENGMAVNAACGGIYESCEQRNNGAFGPNGGANMTIIAVGNAMSIIGGPASAKLATVFSHPPTFDVTADLANDFPGPVAIVIPGTLSTCANAMVCP